MNKFTKFLIVFAFIITFTLSAGTMEAFAATTKTSAKKMSSTKKSLSSTKKRSTKKKITAKKKTTKKTSAKKVSTRRKYVYSRGSGAPIASGDVNKVVSLAKTYLGTRYAYGGTSPRGFDCSGFAQYVYKKVGVSLPRTASGQAAKGLAIRKVSDLKAGDLVFFETYAPGISHVGIYIGSGKFIHASNPRGGVKITSISGTSYASNFRGGTRILN